MRGGARKNAGRPALPKDQKKVPRSLKLDPKIDKYLRQRKNATHEIEIAIRRSKAFRDWMASL